MKLGEFSLSLAVRDLAASRAFYERLGFKVIDGKPEQRWLILRNGSSTIGLFQGKFERNILTFHPGRYDNDVRQIQAHLKQSGVELITETDPDGDGAAHVFLVDPDGNPILIDQYF